jgi:hypothetical protein
MSNIEQKPDYIDKEYISSGGDIVSVRQFLCHRCNQYIQDGKVGHPQCARLAREDLGFEKERQRKEHSKLVFGEVLNPTEYQIRLYPDNSFQGAEPYNKRLERLEEEKIQARFKMLRDRVSRKERLPVLEQQIRVLKAQIVRDEQEIAKETTADTTKQPLQQKIEEEDTETQLQEYVKAREQNQ